MTDAKIALERLRQLDKLMLTPTDICPVLGSDPQTIRDTAKDTPELIGYPYTFVGRNMKIPRIPFLRFMGVEEAGR